MFRMKILDEKNIERAISDYLHKTTWFVKTTRRRVKPVVEKVLRTNDGFLIFIKIDQRTYQLPVICSDREPDEILIRENLYFANNSLYCIEAEYSNRYFEFMKEIGIEYVDFYKINYNVVYSKPLTIDAPNTIGLHELSNGFKIVVKGYRLLDTNTLEPLMYEKLTSSNYRYIPKLYRIYYSTLNGSKKYLSIVVEYIEGSNLEEIYSDQLKNTVKPSLINKYSHDTYSLGLKIGHMIADLHLKLNSLESSNLFGLEAICNSDISKWVKRVEERYEYLLREISRKVDKLDLVRESEREIIDFFTRELDSKKNIIIEHTKEILDKFFINSFKGRTHQDLALNRIIWDGRSNELKIIDFEGERYRDSDELISKEPLVRDLATVINSLYSTAMYTYCRVHTKRSLLRNILKIYRQKIPHIWVWTVRNAIYLIYGYTGLLSSYEHGEKLVNFGEINNRKISLRTHYYLLLTPWIIDRALYETIYKLKTTSVDYIVPLTIVLNPVFPVIKND